MTRLVMQTRKVRKGAADVRRKNCRRVLISPILVTEILSVILIIRSGFCTPSAMLALSSLGQLICSTRPLGLSFCISRLFMIRNTRFVLHGSRMDLPVDAASFSLRVVVAPLSLFPTVLLLAHNDIVPTSN